MNAIPVLLYHSVSDKPSRALVDYTISTGLLAEHAAAIAEQGWRVVTISDLERTIADGSCQDQPSLAITFDDGFADTAERAAGVLSEFGLQATLYVTTGSIGGSCEWLGSGGRRPMASWAQLQDLASAGWEIGAHSVTHPELDILSRSQSNRQIVDSRAALQDGLRLPIDSFAYPHGYHCGAVRRSVIDAGFSSAVAVKNTLSSDRDDSFARARLTVKSDLSTACMSLLLAGSDGPRPATGSDRERVRTTAWRKYRRLRNIVSAGPR